MARPRARDKSAVSDTPIEAAVDSHDPPSAGLEPSPRAHDPFLVRVLQPEWERTGVPYCSLCGWAMNPRCHCDKE